MPSICDGRGEGVLGLLAGRGGLLAGGGGRLALKGTWCNAEDEMLLTHHTTFGNKWAQIAAAMANGRTGQQCLIRFNNQLQPGISKKPWSEDEDRNLSTLKKNGGSWPQIASGLNSGRTAKQCQERWTNLLDTSRTVADWSVDEDSMLLQKHSDLNGQFSQIRDWLPGRSANDCLHRFTRLHPALAHKKKPICSHGVPVRRCVPCDGYDICVHRVNRYWCHKCCGARWRCAVIEKRVQFMMHNSASDLLARVTKMFAKK